MANVDFTRAERIVIEPDPYEQFRIARGYRVGNLVFISGQASINDDGEIVGAGDFDAQAEQVFSNVRCTLEAAGSSMEKIIKVNIYLIDMSHFPKVVE